MAADPCIAEIVEKTGITEKEAREIHDIMQRHKNTRLARGRLDRLDQDLAVLAQDEADKLRFAAALQRKHAALNILKRQQLDTHVAGFALESDGDYKEAFLSILYGSHKRVENARKSVSARREAITAEWVGSLTAEISRQKPHLFAALRKDKQLLDNITREMYEVKPGGKPGITGDPDARFMAELLSKYSETARIRLNEAGAYIGKIGGWVPQAHDAAKLLRKGREAWVADVLPRLDLERSFPGMETTEIQDVLGEIYENIVTGRDTGVSGAEKGQFQGPRNLARGMQKHRVLHFASADEWLEYQAAYGRGNAFTSVLSHLEHSARMTSLMEVLGPNPETMLGSLLESARRQIRTSKDLPDAKKVKAMESLAGDLGKRQGAIGKAFAEVMGETLIPHNLTAAKVSAGIRAVESMAKLGGAVLSSLNDILTYAVNLRFQGKNLFESYGDALGTLLSGKTPKEQKEIAHLLGATYDGIIGDIAMRWNAQDSMPGKMSNLMDTFFRWSGLTWWTDRLRAGYARTTSAWMAMQTPTPWAGLTDGYRRLLGLHGIEEKRWAAMKDMVSELEDGRRYVLPENAESLADDVIDGLIPEKLAQARATLKGDKLASRIERLRHEARRDLRTDVQAFFADELDYAVINPDDRTRAFMTQGTAPGTVLGEVVRFIGQFKSFPIAYTQKMLRARRFQAKEGLDPAGIANLIAGSMVFGYAAMTVKDIAKGKTPRDPRKIETWMAAAVQGGGAGIYGDFLFAKYDRFGGGPVSAIAGPTAGAAGKAIQMGSGLLRGDTKAGDALQFALGNTPFVNLWYTRAALDYGVLYHLQEMLSPGVLHRRERMMKEEYGQEYLLPPSAVIQRGGGFR